MSGRDLLTSRTMILFFMFFMLGAMAGGGVQSWLVTVLHTYKGIDVEVAAVGGLVIWESRTFFERKR